MQYPQQPLLGQYGAPPPQQMQFQGPPHNFLANQEAILVRQRTNVLGDMFGCCNRNNRYDISYTSAQLATREPHMTDEEYVQQPRFAYIQEQTTCCCRAFCQSARETRLGVYANEQIGQLQGDQLAPGFFMKIERPFKCTMIFCCLMCNPPEANFQGQRGEPIGSALCDWRCFPFLCMGEQYIAVRDSAQNVKYYLRAVNPTLCNGCRNCLAPTCFNPVWVGDILDGSGTTVVGTWRNVFPGCKGIRCLLNMANYAMVFPQGSSPEDKANLLGALMLAEFVIHEKSPEEQQGVAM